MNGIIFLPWIIFLQRTSYTVALLSSDRWRKKTVFEWMVKIIAKICDFDLLRVGPRVQFWLLKFQFSCAFCYFAVIVGCFKRCFPREEFRQNFYFDLVKFGYWWSIPIVDISICYTLCSELGDRDHIDPVSFPFQLNWQLSILFIFCSS